MLSILIYIQERFPVIPVLLFTFGYSALAIGVASSSNPWFNNPNFTISILVLLSSVFFFFLLRQRTIDEFRDAQHDLKNYPDRPIPRGLISKKQLLMLGGFALFTEWVSVYLLGASLITTYIFVFVYSLLMAKEFFLSEWLNKHFTLYFFVHEIIFLLFGTFFIRAINWSFLNFNTLTLSALVVLVAAPVSIEIIRKFKPRYDKTGKVVADTYGTVWGRNNALLALMVLSTSIALGLYLIKNSLYFLIFSALMLIAWSIFAQKSDKAAILIGAINFLGFAILANLIW